MVFVTVNNKKLIVIPKDIRKAWGLREGDKLNVYLDERRNEVVLEKMIDVKTACESIFGLWKDNKNIKERLARARRELDERIG